MDLFAGGEAAGDDSSAGKWLQCELGRSGSQDALHYRKQRHLSGYAQGAGYMSWRPGVAAKRPSRTSGKNKSRKSVENFQRRKSDPQEPRFHHNLSTKNHPKTTFCAPESAKSP